MPSSPTFVFSALWGKTSRCTSTNAHRFRMNGPTHSTRVSRTYIISHLSDLPEYTLFTVFCLFLGQRIKKIEICVHAPCHTSISQGNKELAFAKNFFFSCESSAAAVGNRLFPIFLRERFISQTFFLKGGQSLFLGGPPPNHKGISLLLSTAFSSQTG